MLAQAAQARELLTALKAIDAGAPGAAAAIVSAARLGTWPLSNSYDRPKMSPTRTGEICLQALCRPAWSRRRRGTTAPHPPQATY